MHIPDCSEGSVEVEFGGFVNVSQSAYQGRRVALKVVRVYITSDLEVILSVSLVYPRRSTCLNEWIAEILFILSPHVLRRQANPFGRVYPNS